MKQIGDCKYQKAWEKVKRANGFSGVSNFNFKNFESFIMFSELLQGTVLQEKFASYS